MTSLAFIDVRTACLGAGVSLVLLCADPTHAGGAFAHLGAAWSGRGIPARAVGSRGAIRCSASRSASAVGGPRGVDATCPSDGARPHAIGDVAEQDGHPSSL